MAPSFLRVPVALAIALAAWQLPFVARAGASAGLGRSPSQQGKPERFWIAARYDATQLVTYFEAVQFGTLPTRDNQFVQPRTPDFFGPRPIAAAELERVRPRAGEPFRIGDRYEVLTADGSVVSMILSSFVKFHSDEAVGNDSYIGALGRVAAADLPKLRGNYFVVRHPDSPAIIRGSRAGLTDGSLPPAVSSKLLGIVGGRRLIAAQAFTTAAGDARQLVIASVGTGQECRTRVSWLTGQPEFRVLGTEEMPSCGSPLYAGIRLRAAVDMGSVRTGLVLVLSGEGGHEVRLVEYVDGAKLADMRVWQTVRVGH